MRLTIQCNSDERVALTLKVGDKRVFDAAASAKLGAQSRSLYMERVWRKANAVFFDNQLKMPKLGFKKTMNADSFKGLGVWKASSRVLAVSQRIFNSPEYVACEIIVHEMCHQAVSEIDHVSYSEQDAQGHGEHWQKWMRHCGLTPSRYATDDRDVFHSEVERDEKTEQKRVKETTLVDKKQISKYDLRDDLPAQIFHDKRKEWVKGIIVGRVDVLGLRWYFVEYPMLNQSVYMIKNDQFYEITDDDMIYYSSKAFTDVAAQLREYYPPK